MLAYAADRRRLAERPSAPNTMLVIVAVHVAAVAALMSARMDLPMVDKFSPTVVDLIREDDPPPPVEMQPDVPAPPLPSTLAPPPPLVPTPPATPLDIEPRPLPLPDLPDIRPAPTPEPQPRVEPAPRPPARTAHRLATPASDLKPPYPASKLASGEEAVLRLRLTIDERGRVVAVEPVGPADPAFLAAARRHLLARWRYKPATEDGRAVASVTVVTLRFQLEG